MSKEKKNSDLRDEEILAQHSGRRGTARVMTSMAIAQIGNTPPFFLEKGVKINAQVYLSHLNNCFFPHMSMIATTANEQKSSMLMQDGVSAHRTAEVLRAIKKNAGKPFPLEWPAKSPGLNPRDFFLRGATQEFVDSTEKPPVSENQLKGAVMMAAASVGQETVKKAVDSVYRRCRACVMAKGGRFEHMMK